MNSNLYCILSYCNSPAKVLMLENTINSIRKAGYDTLVISPLPLPANITSIANFFIHQKDNPVLYFPEKYTKYWKSIPIGGSMKQMSVFIPDYGYTVYNQIKTVHAFTDDLLYTQYTFINYDTQITPALLGNFKDNLVSKVDNEVDGFLFPSLIFFSFTRTSLNHICGKISRQDYIQNTDGKNPEDYLTHLMDRISYEVLEEPVNDLADFKFSDNDDFWNLNTHSTNFKLFFDKNSIIVYELKQNIVINLDGKDVQLQENFIGDLPKINFGFYDDTGKLVDLTHLIKVTRLYKIQ